MERDQFMSFDAAGFADEVRPETFATPILRLSWRVSFPRKTIRAIFRRHIVPSSGPPNDFVEVGLAMD